MVEGRADPGWASPAGGVSLAGQAEWCWWGAVTACYHTAQLMLWQSGLAESESAGNNEGSHTHSLTLMWSNAI